MTYCLFVWNKRLVQSTLDEKWYKHSPQEPITIKNKMYKHPVLCINDKVHKMVPLAEFLGRLEHSRMLTTVRACNNEAEDKYREDLKKLISADIVDTNIVQPSYWNFT
jgi:predicted secreted protein